MVEDCAALATQAAAELEQLARAEAFAPGPGPGLAAIATDRPPRLVSTAAYPEHLREEVERYLEAMRFSEEALTAGLEEAMRYSLLAGGKRIRPVLALATRAARWGWRSSEVLPLAGAIELIHTYSLIHDDLPAMDDDALRRGQPTCHVKFGEDVAILAGDGLYAEAFHHLLSRRASPPRAGAGGGRRAGGRDRRGRDGRRTVRRRERRGRRTGREALRRLHELKTGRLIGASVLCVLLLAGLEDGPATIAFRRFAAELGVLFQIVDDILDVTGTDDALGKPRGSDERHGKRTYVSEFGIERARELAAESHRTAREALAAAGGADRSGGCDRRARADHRLHLHPHLMSSQAHTSSAPEERARAHADNNAGPARRPARADRRARRTCTALSDEELAQLAQEVREHIIDTVGEIGGHFGANLGTCELAVALHSLLDSPTRQDPVGRRATRPTRTRSSRAAASS